MSIEKNNQYIIDEVSNSSSKKDEAIIILNLIDEISKLEEKITQLKNSAISQNEDDITNNEISKLQNTINKLTKEMNDLSVNILLDVSNKENLIKKKSYLIKDITKKINNYKNILSTYNTLSFNSPLLKKYISSNKKNLFLTDEQIDDIMSKTQTIYNNDNLIQKYEKEYEVNKEELINIENNRKKILQKINEMKENLKMMKEEKLTTKNELVNYISSKETLESIIKVNLPTVLDSIKEENEENKEEEIKNDLKSNEKNSFISNKDMHSQNRVNTINSITEEDNDNENNNIELVDISSFNLNNNIYNSKKKWDETINLYKYELFYLDANKISAGISNEIFDIISNKIINDNPINNNQNVDSLRNSIKLESKKTTNILDKNNKTSAFNNNIRYGNGRNPMVFSCESPIIKKTRTNIFLFNDMNDCKKEIQVELKNIIQNYINNINNNKISIDNFIEKITELIVNKLNEYGHFLNKKNLMIYLTCYLKKSFYECMISFKLKFINKDYKSIKKNYKKKIENLQDQLTKLNSRLETIKNTIILQENKIKLLNKIENIDNKKIKDNNDIHNNIGNLKLTLDEQNYIQLCRKVNSYINEKNEIEREIEETENDKKVNKYQGELKINSINNEINDIKQQINTLHNDSLNKKIKTDEEITKIRKIINEKFSKIKLNLEKYKSICINNDINIYNNFIDNIKNNIDNKYYKSLLDLEKVNNLNTINSNSSSNKSKNKELKTNIETFNHDIDSDNINQFTFSNMPKTHRKTNSDIIKPITLNEDYFSPVNSHKKKNYYDNENEPINDFNSTSKKNKINYDNKNRIKNNNYINVFDSCNNLNNYYFQFQTPSTVISFNDNKKYNNFFLNSTYTNRNNKNEINIRSYNSPFSSLKISSSKKKMLSPKDYVKPTNLINSLKYCVSDRNHINKEINNKNNNNTIKAKDFSLDKDNIKNIYITKSSSAKKNKIINNLIYGYSKEENNFIFNNNKNDNDKNYIYNSLFRRTFCYFRILNNNDINNKEYNPFDNKTIPLLCKTPYNYIKSTLSFDKKEDMIKIIPSNQLETINLKIDRIERTFIDSEMKIIIDIYKGFNAYKNKNDNDDINKYIKEVKKRNISYIHLKDEYIKKCCYNKYFVLSIIIKNKNKKRIEFLFCSYEEFELWNNAICFFIKNNNNGLLFNLNKRKKFEYP